MEQSNNTQGKMIMTKEVIKFAEAVSCKLECDVYLVGSALFKDDPRDIDIRAIMPIKQFEDKFMPVEQFEEESVSGNWSDKRYYWVKITKDCWKLEKITGEIHPILDFQIHYEGKYKEDVLILAMKKETYFVNTVRL